MKFFVSRDIKESSLIRSLAIWFLLSLTLFFVLQPWTEKEALGLSVTELTNKIVGNSILFIPPLGFDQLVEVIHIDLFLRLIAALSLLALTVRLMKNKKIIFAFVLSLNISIFFNALSPLLLHFGLGAFAGIKVLAYWTQQGLFCFLIAFCLLRLLLPAPVESLK